VVIIYPLIIWQFRSPSGDCGGYLFDNWLFNDSVSNTWIVYFSRIAWLLKMGPKGCTETSITTNLRCVTSLKSESLILKHTHI
jgi:hypothetical protein